LACVYTEFACIVDYLIKQYGKEKFLSYMKELTDGNEHDSVFKRIYNIEFNKCIHDFRESKVARIGIVRQTIDRKKLHLMSNTYIFCKILIC
jgi:hypothetical protein